jgi:tetratricopeptide (TPR) repeat protein
MVLLFFSLISHQLSAKIYHIPDHLWQEYKQKKQIYQQNNSNLDACFEYAMTCAYTGQIKKGWDALKTLPPTYSIEVISKYYPLSEENPDEWTYKFKLAFGYFFDQKKDEAIKEFQKVLKIKPKHIWAMGFISLIEGERGHVDEAIKWAEKANRIEPNAAAIHFLLEEGYRKKGDIFKAFIEACKVGRLLTEEAAIRPDE